MLPSPEVCQNCGKPRLEGEVHQFKKEGICRVWLSPEESYYVSALLPPGTSRDARQRSSED